MKIDLFLIPGPVEPDRLKDKTLVVIDVLRATTTICQSLYAGAKAVIPVEQPGEAAELRAKIGGEDSILGGERNNVKIENFNLGNSPLEYTQEIVQGKSIILTTTNGTKLFARGKYASLIVAAGFVNITQIARKVAMENRDTTIICAGDQGDFSIEDTLCGGMLIDQLIGKEKIDVQLNDSASLALLLYNDNKQSILGTIANGQHGRELREMGFEDDVIMASKPDSIPVLPIYNSGRIIREEN